MATVHQSMASPVVNKSCVWTMLIITISVYCYYENDHYYSYYY